MHTELVHLADEKYTMTSKTRSWVLGIIVVGLVLTILGLVMHLNGGSSTHHDEHAMASIAADGSHDAAAAQHEEHHASPMARVWSNLLINSWFFFLLAILATFFIGVNYLAQAGWAVGLKRVPEAFGAYLPVALITLLATVIFGGHSLYHWMQEGITDPNSPNYDAVIKNKSPFLNAGFLYGGVVIIIGIFIFFRMKLRNLSLKEDQEGGLTFFRMSIRFSAAFTFIFAFAFSILAWLVVMSVDPHWFSTIFSVYNFATGFVSAMAAITLFVLFLKSQGYLSFINEEHLHDLGKFQFAFSIFWTYIWLAQYLLIWYANLPEEVTYYANRVQTGYYNQFWLNVILNFAIPFLGYMTRAAKRTPATLILFGSIILIGHWNDVYLMVTPAVLGEEGHIGLLEIGMPLLFGGVFIWVVLNALSKANLFPKNHPYLQESIQHEVGP